MIPGDPVILLSFVNTKLRDYYGSIEVMCEELSIDRLELQKKLSGIDYHYDRKRNQFI